MSQIDITFRPFKKGEEKKIADLMWKLNKEDVEELPQSDQKIQSLFDYVKQTSQAQIFVCIHNKTNIGYATFLPCYSVEFGGLWGIIEELYIEKEFRNSGLGTKFIQWIEKYAKEKGYKALYLEAYQGNKKAQKLYKSLGFHSFPWNYYLKEI